MLSDSEFNNWCGGLNLSSIARQVIELIRSSEPSRRVGGGRRNVSGRYPSKKMGVTIQFESHKVELPFIYQLEHDDDVLEFYDQPSSFKLSYQSEDGRNLGFFYTPDFFVIRTDSVGWVECKTERELKNLASKSPARYFKRDDGQWLMPPGAKYASQFGFFFRLFSDEEIRWVLQRNITFLEDYYRTEEPVIRDSSTKTVLSLVSSQPGITLNQLHHYASGVSPDEINFLIATEQIYVDLNAAPLVEPEQCFVFRDQQTAKAYRSMILSQVSSDVISFPVIDLSPGTSVYYDGKTLAIAIVGNTEILLKTENSETVELSKRDFENYLQSGKITVFPSGKSELNASALDFMLKASSKDLEASNRRYKLLQQYFRGEPLEDSTVNERTLRRWRAKYWQAEQKYGYGYIGLLSYDSVKGNRNRKLPEHLLSLIDKFITEDYETYKQKRKFEGYGAFAKACSSAQISNEDLPSYKTLIKEIKKRSGYAQTLKREGSRVAYSK